MEVLATARPPMYLQRHGHSMTIVGIEIRKNGNRNLLVFDPAYNTSKILIGKITADSNFKHAPSLLKPYRRGKRQLKRYNVFETLRLIETGLLI